MEHTEIPRDLRVDITSKVETILRTQFHGPKSEIYIKHDRITFACPYCGDSENDRKKRANVYWNTGMFHCYNGGCTNKHNSVLGFLKDFNERITDLDSLTLITDVIKTKEFVKAKVEDYFSFGVFNTLMELSIDKADIISRLNLVPVTKDLDVFRTFFKPRLIIRNLHKYAYDPVKNQIYIFNLAKDKVIGLQIRALNKNVINKYISFNIEKMYKDILKRDLPAVSNVEKVNTMSLYFGIFEIDFSTEFTIFEGPIDSDLYPHQSIATCGVEKSSDMFDELDHVKYFSDNDYPGIKNMETKLKQKKKVFLWKKFMQDFKLPDDGFKKIKDYNDIIKYCFYNKKYCHKAIDRYFSNHKLDIYHI